MLEDFSGRDSLVRIDFQQLAEEVFSLLGDGSEQLRVEYIVGVENLVPEGKFYQYLLETRDQRALPEFHGNLSVLTEGRTACQENVENNPEAPAVHLQGVDPLPEGELPALELARLQNLRGDVLRGSAGIQRDTESR